MKTWPFLATLLAIWITITLALRYPFTSGSISTGLPTEVNEVEVNSETGEYKYFYEPGSDDILGHYDVRFFKGVLSSEDRADVLVQMIWGYLDFFDENGLETWLAHGTLLGWWWNGKILPWDWDIDTQISHSTLTRLANIFNQTIVQYPPSPQKRRRRYLLDINPWSLNPHTQSVLNIIDARWIDTETGLYIDITALRNLDTTQPYLWQCKNGHQYRVSDLYPLRKTSFEGVKANVPFRYGTVIVEEYSIRALFVTRFHNHTWVKERGEWVSDDKVVGPSPDAWP